MKVIIVGAGISGLSTYLLFRKHFPNQQDNNVSSPKVTVKIYDAYEMGNAKEPAVQSQVANGMGDGTIEPAFTPAAIGNAIGITRNGIQVLRRLDQSGAIAKRVLEKGHQISKWRISNARGWSLAEVSMIKTSLEAQENTTDNTSLMIARQDLWEVLRDEVLKDEGVVVKKKVEDIVIGKGRDRSVVTFSDGTSDEADLIIGADGLRSVLRRVMFEDRDDRVDADGQLRNDKNMVDNNGWLSWIWSSSTFVGGQKRQRPDYITPHFEGLVGIGSFIPTTVLESSNSSPPEPGTMSIIFGPNGFFGHGCVSSDPNDAQKPGPTSFWWSTFSSDSPTPYSLPSTTATTTTTTTNNKNNNHKTFNTNQATQDLLTRHQNWKNPTVQSILEHVVKTTDSTSNTTSVYATYTTPELPTWQHTNKTILIGDAAHALQPSSGQGASQGLEDAESLVLLLRHYHSCSVSSVDLLEESESEREQEATGLALRKFVDLRIPRVHAVYERSQRMSRMKMDIGFVMEMVMYFAVWVSALLHDKFNDELISYDLPAEVERIVKE